jgi:type II secretory pathway pseudopilin PulG
MLLLLAAAALASGVRIPRLAGFALVAALLASLIPNLLTLREAAGVFRVNGAVDRAELAAVELAGSRADPIPIETPQTTPDLTYDLPIPPQDYLTASKRLGSAAVPASSLTNTIPEARRAADLTLIRLYRLAPRPSGATAAPIVSPAPALESGAAGLSRVTSGCVSARSRQAGTPLSFVLPRGGFTLRAAKGAPVR